MLFIDLIQETFFSLKSNKSRSFLTILGIVIGIGSVITMIGIGQGATQDIEKNIQSLGSNLLVISPGSQRSYGSTLKSSGSVKNLTTDDAEAIKEQIQNIDRVAPTVSNNKQVSTKGENTNTSIYGVDTQYFIIKDIEIEIGNLINDQNVKKISKIAVLGTEIRNDLFGENVNPVGEKIKISDQQFTVIGVIKAKGATGMGQSSDNIVYIPLSTAQHYLTGSDSLGNINIQVVSEELMTIVQDSITNLLLIRHKITDPTKADFNIMNQADILDTMSSITGTLTLLLAAIASISLVVGGIGIMNMMLTIVTERTREIGLRKSLGAKNTDISLQFLAESIMLTFIGGIIGIICGYFAAALITKLSGTTTDVTMWSVYLAFGVSAAIGIIFGYYPAKRAAKLNPIDALRYE